MDTKLTTKTWSEAPQVSSLKSDSKQTIDAKVQKELLNGRSFGEYLNKVADPNWVDPAKTREVGNGELDKEAFLKLMLTQLKNQDPMNPQKSHEMAAQLAQFTSLEQLTNINTNIESLKAQQAPGAKYEALKFIGKTVSGDSSLIPRAANQKEHDIRLQLLGDAKEVNVKINNAEGQTIRTYTLHDQKKGPLNVQWNGRDENDQIARPGDYHLVVEAQGEHKKKIGVKTDFSGTITGVNFTPSGPVLMVGKQAVKLSDIQNIADPALADSNSRTGASSEGSEKQDGSNQHLAQEGKVPSSAPGKFMPLSAQQSLGDVALSKKLLNEINQQSTAQQEEN